MLISFINRRKTFSPVQIRIIFRLEIFQVFITISACKKFKLKLFEIVGLVRGKITSCLLFKYLLLLTICFTFRFKWARSPTTRWPVPAPRGSAWSNTPSAPTHLVQKPVWGKGGTQERHRLSKVNHLCLSKLLHS